MTDYHLSWLTPQMATGRAPMSYAELDFIRSQGINAIINLCAEFSDLHELEKGSGFEVFYLPVWDNEAPEMAALENGLAWLDEALYLGKKVLIHCRHGIGRTGTLATSYFMRKGISLKAAAKRLKHYHTAPTSISQRKLLKLYGRNTTTLTLREPDLEQANAVDLTTYISEYESLVKDVCGKIKTASTTGESPTNLGLTDHGCCVETFDMPLIEAICLNKKMDITLSSELRTTIIEAAGKIYKSQAKQCPLYRDKKCLLHGSRPLRCLTWGLAQGLIDQQAIDIQLRRLSKNVFLALTGQFSGNTPLSFSIAKTLSGKYVQEYFEELARLTRQPKN